jgi:hypothetical protein
MHISYIERLCVVSLRHVGAHHTDLDVLTKLKRSDGSCPGLITALREQLGLKVGPA